MSEENFGMKLISCSTQLTKLMLKALLEKMHVEVVLILMWLCIVELVLTFVEKRQV